jgi:cell division protein FtsL
MGKFEMKILLIIILLILIAPVLFMAGVILATKLTMAWIDRETKKIESERETTEKSEQELRECMEKLKERFDGH